MGATANPAQFTIDSTSFPEQFWMCSTLIENAAGQWPAARLSPIRLEQLPKRNTDGARLVGGEA